MPNLLEGMDPVPDWIITEQTITIRKFLEIQIRHIERHLQIICETCQSCDPPYEVYPISVVDCLERLTQRLDIVGILDEEIGVIREYEIIPDDTKNLDDEVPL